MRSVRTTRRRAGLAAIALAATFATWAAEELAIPATPSARALPGIVGHDDRVPLDSTAWPWQAVGRVNQAGGRSHCTGTLVAPDTVLTAAHCVYSRLASRWLEPGEIVFVAGFRRDTDAGYSRGKTIRRSPQADPTAVTADSIAHDWALITLETPLPVRPVEVRTLSPAKDGTVALETAGYAQDRPYLLSLDDGCRIRERAFGGKVLVTDCDSTRGDSGAPLLWRDGDTVRVVGVFSAATEASAKAAGSFAVDASAFADQLQLR
ncbi:trypsin-like serine peptidase [Methylotetracoccus oryzae]|uniref:trypsin-like serine peptidase n=1 Tax=Methylotetracoccus oryzae TaxID=1919059 RepID=UPI0013A5806C|nr:trypsin-like serine protease [Methylotetracoccus oryzae]